MAESSADNTMYQPIFVARQPIFTPKLDIWGYELLFRHSGTAGQAQFPDSDVATSKVIADGYDLAQSGLSSGIKALVNFPRKLLLEEAAYTLPAEQAVIEILETVSPEPEVLQACNNLKANNYLLAVDDFVGQPGYEPLLELADIVKVDVLNMNQAQISQIAKNLRPYNCQLLAEKVETQEVFNQTLQLGFDFFQGFFFSKPEIVPGRSLSSNQVSRLRLLNNLSKEEFQPSEFSKIIQSDLSLSYRLLRYINSPSLGLIKEITSIEHAVRLLGQKPLLRWLRIIVMADLNPSVRGMELISRSAQRGRYLQLLSEVAPETPFSADSMFLFGLFSLLDAILDQPMGDILKHLPLEPQLVKALTQGEEQTNKWLELLKAQERGNWAQAENLFKELQLPEKKSAICYIQAMQWANALLDAQED
jgi:EAL and modified HD-GYP domain-containing signal transduction protein